MSEVIIKHLVKTYAGGVRALKDIDLEIERGEFVVLVGPSGCGKTTLLRIIAGLEQATSGEIFIGGELVNDVKPAQRGLAMVFQDYALYPHMSVRENLAFGLEQSRMEKTEMDRRIANAASVLGLESLLGRRPSELSGGQRQRVAIGRALVKQPRVFLFDEPLSNLDAQLRAQTRIELASLHRRIGSTTIYVTHDQVEAMTLADRIVVMETGRIRQVGRPLDLYHRPANTFVGGFIGSPGLNFLEGELALVPGGDRELVFSKGRLKLRAEEAPNASGSVVMGIRPEDLSFDGRGEIAVRVLQIEPHGHETHVLVDVGSEHPWTVRVSGETGLEIGQTVSLKLDHRALHWFEAKGDRNHLEVARRPTPTLERIGRRDESPPPEDFTHFHP